ncbi:hypothetical protein HA45_21845 [Pantoea rodasii]|nr:hypothetical protein HA45_21845 [Pantoea rodasii]
MLSIFLAACHSYEGVRLSHPSDQNLNSYFILTPAIGAGDNIRYELMDGTKQEAVVSSVNGKTINLVDGKIVQISQIKSLDKKEFSGGKTAAVVGGSAATVAIIWVSVFAIAVGAAVAAA